MGSSEIHFCATQFRMLDANTVMRRMQLIHSQASLSQRTSPSAGINEAQFGMLPGRNVPNLAVAAFPCLRVSSSAKHSVNHVTAACVTLGND